MIQRDKRLTKASKRLNFLKKNKGLKSKERELREWERVTGLERKTLREAGLPEAEEAMRLTSTAHGSPVQRQRRRPGASAERSTASTSLQCWCDEALRCDDDEEELAAATTTAMWPSMGYWVWCWFVYWRFFVVQYLDYGGGPTITISHPTLKYEFNFSFSVFFFFFFDWESVGLPWASYL